MLCACHRATWHAYSVPSSKFCTTVCLMPHISGTMEDTLMLQACSGLHVAERAIAKPNCIVTRGVTRPTRELNSCGMLANLPIPRPPLSKRRLARLQSIFYSLAPSNRQHWLLALQFWSSVPLAIRRNKAAVMEPVSRTYHELNSVKRCETISCRQLYLCHTSEWSACQV